MQFICTAMHLQLQAEPRSARNELSSECSGGSMELRLCCVNNAELANLEGKQNMHWYIKQRNNDMLLLDRLFCSLTVCILADK